MGSVGSFITQTIGGLLGASYDEPDPPSYDIPATPESEIEPASKAVRTAEERKLKNRRLLSGTILTSPLGTLNSGTSTGLLGSSASN